MPPPDVGATVLAALGAAADRVWMTEPPALNDEPDGVHQQRTAVRRLRSLLAAFRPLLDGPAAEWLRAQYGEWGRQLGTVRDIEVRADQLEQLLDARQQARTDAAGGLRSLVDITRADYRRAHARLVELHASPRGARRHEALADLLASPLLAPDVSRPAEAELARILAGEVKRVHKRQRRLDGSLEGFHRLRKAARRLRYTAEALTSEPTPVFGDRVSALAAKAETVHDLLGDHRDALVVAAWLERESALAARRGEPVAVYRELMDRARAVAHARIAGLEDALDALAEAANTALP
ncbi:CHAD domain-containing protein [Rathayibacter sp. YIM 133350]|uniref:CHAD domain-containing protein n=1 Tax=Rathayibacter sp. YIM 133350 TaxID=3131992 RepID=UPI00307F4237